MLDRLEALAHKKGVSAAQLSLAWLLHKGRDVGVALLPIPGTKTLRHALDNIASASVPLSREEMVGRLEDIATSDG